MNIGKGRVKAEKCSLRYQPKGGMCMTCIDAPKDCSMLPFGDMRVHGFTDSAIIVICSEYRKSPSTT